MTQPQVPIVPGNSEPYTLATVMPAPVKPPRPRSVLPTIAGLVVLVLGMGGLAAWALTRSGNGEPAAQSALSPTPVMTALRAAINRCYAGEISDADRTLFIDLGGENLGSGWLTFEDLTCILDELGAPTYVTTVMRETRALDGRQSETWGAFEASWTYHPNQGLDVLIREVG